MNIQSLVEKIESKNKIISNHQKRIELLDGLRHYWYCRGFFNDKEFHICLSKLLNNHNPFLRFKQKLLTNDKSKEYKFDSFIFEYRLFNDYCIVCQKEIDFDNQDNRSICWKCHHYLCKEHIPDPVNSCCKACLAKINGGGS